MIKIRLADLFDIDSIFLIETKCFVPGIRCETDGPFVQQVSSFPQGMMVAELDGKIVGYIMGELVPKGWDLRQQHSFMPVGDNLYITSFAVLPETQGHGVGKTLYQTFVSSFPGKPIIGVVNPKWVHVHRFYKSMGIHDVAEIEDFFHPEGRHESGMIMSSHPI